MSKRHPQKTSYLPLIKSILFSCEIKPTAFDMKIIETPEDARNIGIMMAKKATKHIKLSLDV